MNFSTFPPNTTQTADPLRLRKLIRVCLEPKCVQVRPRINLYTLTGRVACCSPSIAMHWVQELASDALSGDLGASETLPLAVEHYLRVVRQARF